MRQLPGRFVVGLLGLILAWGAFERFYRLDGQPLWCDEAWAALTAADLSYGGLLTQTDVPLPPLFGVALKAAGQIPASAELTLRLLPAVCGVLLLPLTYLAVRALRMPRTIALGATGLCASSILLVTVSRQAKQYSVEAFFAVLMAWLVLEFRRRGPSERRRALFAAIVLVCLLAPWLGYGAVFPLFVLALMPGVLPRRGPMGGRRPGATVAALAALAVSFACLWLVAARGQADHAPLVEYARRWCIEPLSLHSWLRAAGNGSVASACLFFPMEWFFASTEGLQALGMWTLAGLIWVLAGMGLYCWPSSTRREMAWWLLGSWLALVIAAALGRYPFGLTRMMAFVVPPTAIAVTAGIVGLARALSLHATGRTAPALVASVWLGAVPAVYMLRVPLQYCYIPYHDFPRLLQILERERRPGEWVFVDVTAVAPVRYYAPDIPPPLWFAPVTAGAVPAAASNDPGVIDYVARRAGWRWWLLTTDGQGWQRYSDLLARIEQHGYTVKVFARADECDRSRWIAELLVATRR
jgi:hypothetical protein